MSPEGEFAAALDEIGHITRLRLVARVEGPGAPKTEGRLSTHVLDTVTGKPAAGVRVRLYEIGASARALVAETVTNADGRTDKPLIGGQPLRCGIYELEFAIGDYFRRIGQPLATPAFLDTVPLRFGIASPRAIITCRCWRRPGATRPTGELRRTRPHLLPPLQGEGRGGVQRSVDPEAPSTPAYLPLSGGGLTVGSL